MSKATVKNYVLTAVVCAGGLTLVPAPSQAANLFEREQLDLHPTGAPAAISDGAPIDKARLLRLPDGTLIAGYGQEYDQGGSDWLAWDAQLRAPRRPFDVYVRYSLDKGLSWSAAINLSNSAGLSSARGIVAGYGMPMLGADGHPDLGADPNARDYPGDADKASLFNAGNNILVTWGSKYCPGGRQRFLVYPELGGVTVPYSCLYAARLQWDATNRRFKPIGPGGLPFRTEQLTSGERDVKQDANRGNSMAFVITWQEDPLGLALGEAEGPGDGGSGAKTSGGTDAWYAVVPAAQFAAGAWNGPVRVTRNTTAAITLPGGAAATHAPGVYDTGPVGVSRVNVAQIESNVLVAYEESKGASGASPGKYVRYHGFAYDAPPAGGEIGCILSDPLQNARRVRVLTQPATERVPLVFLFRQGAGSQGAPADIVLRRGVGGIAPEAIVPAIDVAHCRSSVVDGGDPLTELGAGHAGAVNVSGSTDYGGASGTTTDTSTEANPAENAIAHRGTLRGETLVVGYSYTPDLVRFNTLDDEAPYNFYLRRSGDGGDTWADAVNMTPEITPASGLTVREPRLVGASSSGPACKSDPTDCQDPEVLFLAYGTHTNVVGTIESVVDVDLFVRVSMDDGAHWSATQALTAGNALRQKPDDMEDFEAQLKLRPDGREAFVVWSGDDGSGPRMLFRSALVAGDARAMDVVDEPGTAVLAVVAQGGGVAVIRTVQWAAASGYPRTPTMWSTLRFGVLHFSLDEIQPGGGVVVSLKLPAALRDGSTLWRYVAAAGNEPAHWKLMDGAQFSGDTVSVVLTDGGEDEDAQADGALSATIAVVEPVPMPEATGGGGGALGWGIVLLLVGAATVGVRARPRTRSA